MSESKRKRVRVLFLAWGYSINARRRIQLFTEDPAFEVTIVSTHDYGFSGAENILLPSVRSLVGRVLGSIRHRSGDLLLFRLFEDGWRSMIDLVRLAGVVKKRRPGVIFLQTMLYPCYLALLLPPSIPLMVTIWNGDVIWWAKYDGIERLLKKRIVTRVARRARAITVNSQAARDACLGYGAPAGNIHLIRYPGVDTERFRPGDRQVARQRLGLSAGPVVFAPRGLGGYLNSEVILEAAALVAREVPDVRFMISCAVAAGDTLEKHKSLALSLGIEKNCLWIPSLAWEEMPGYYDAADVMVSISSNDSLPNCMLESMACGVPVIMGDIPQIADWVVDETNGFLVPPRNPAVLAQRIVHVLHNRNQVKDTVVRNALALVRDTMATRTMMPLIKKLVLDTAAATGEGPRP